MRTNRPRLAAKLAICTASAATRTTCGASANTSILCLDDGVPRCTCCKVPVWGVWVLLYIYIHRFSPSLLAFRLHLFWPRTRVESEHRADARRGGRSDTGARSSPPAAARTK